MGITDDEEKRVSQEEEARSAVEGRGKRVGPRSPAVFSTPVRSQRPKISRMTASPIKHSSARRNIFPEQQRESNLISMGKELEENQPADQGCATSFSHQIIHNFDFQYLNFCQHFNFTKNILSIFLHYIADVDCH